MMYVFFSFFFFTQSPFCLPLIFNFNFNFKIT
jgi:hypothetical protein